MIKKLHQIAAKFGRVIAASVALAMTDATANSALCIRVNPRNNTRATQVVYYYVSL